MLHVSVLQSVQDEEVSSHVDPPGPELRYALRESVTGSVHISVQENFGCPRWVVAELQVPEVFLDLRCRDSFVKIYSQSSSGCYEGRCPHELLQTQGP